jgi:hypothetical protein
MDEFVRSEQARLSGAKGALWTFQLNSANAGEAMKSGISGICGEYEDLGTAYKIKMMPEHIYGSPVG